tara:strand:+ start:1230 stop:2123 length:894 start_codon:yes stop_codon:yes gene_type:complete
MKTTKIRGLQIVPPKSESGSYETDTFMPKMHQVCVAVGKRASGKSTAIINLIERLKFDYTIAVSPTMNSNRELMERLNIEHTFEDVDDPTVIDKIKDIVKGEAEDLERYKEELKKYNRLMKDLKEGKYMDDDLLLQFFSDEGHFQKPEHRFNGQKPRIAVIFDDLLGSGIYSRPRKLNGLSTYSRHVGSLKEGGAIGVSLFFLIQSFKCQTGGLNKVIRNQCTSMLLFKTKDKQEMKDVAESVSGEIDEELFNKVYDTAIKDGSDYPFLFIDLHKKKEHPSCFRRRFDEFIIPEELK